MLFFINKNQRKRCTRYIKCLIGFLLQEGTPQKLPRKVEGVGSVGSRNLKTHHVGSLDQSQAFYQGNTANLLS